MLSQTTMSSLLRILDRLADKFSHSYANTRLTRDDFYSAGEEGLALALDRYDPTKNAQITTFATAYISGYMNKEVDRWIGRDADFDPFVSTEDYQLEDFCDDEEPAWMIVDRLLSSAPLTEREDTIIRERFLEGRSSNEVAAALHFTPQTVNSDIRKATAKMRLVA